MCVSRIRTGGCAAFERQRRWLFFLNSSKLPSPGSSPGCGCTGGADLSGAAPSHPVALPAHECGVTLARRGLWRVSFLKRAKIYYVVFEKDTLAPNNHRLRPPRRCAPGCCRRAARGCGADRRRRYERGPASRHAAPYSRRPFKLGLILFCAAPLVIASLCSHRSKFSGKELESIWKAPAPTKGHES